MRSKWLTGVLCAVVFAVAVAETLRLASQVLDAWRVRAPTVGLNLLSVLSPELEKIAAGRGDPNTWRIAFLGDSISIRMQAGARTVPRALRSELAESGELFELRSLAGLGTGPFDYYFLADLIADARPDQVVFAFSLQSLGNFPALARERLSGWVAPRRVLRVALAPVYSIGLTADDLLMNVAIVNAGVGEIWRQLLIAQARLGVARQTLADGLGARIGGRGPQNFEHSRFAALMKRTRERDGTRYNVDAERNHYGAVFKRLAPDHPALSVLADTLEVLGDAGVQTLVYVNPINVEHLSALGLLDDDRLSESLETLESVVRGAGGEFLDLHDLLPDAAFRDHAGHLGTPEWVDAPDLIAQAVAPLVLARARARVGQNWK